MKKSLYLPILIGTLTLYSTNSFAQNAVATIHEAKTGKILGNLTLKESNSKVEASLVLKGLQTVHTDSMFMNLVIVAVRILNRLAVISIQPRKITDLQQVKYITQEI